MEQSPFAFEEGIQNMQMNAERYSAEVANYPGDICAFGQITGTGTLIKILKVI